MTVSRAQKYQIHLTLWPLPGSLDPSKTVLPPGRECNPAPSGVPGPVRDPGQALGISKGLQHEVQGHPQQPKWTSKGMPSNLQWDTNGQQLAIHRSIESSYHRILSLGAGGRGRSHSYVLNLLSESQNLKLTGAPPPAAGPCPKCSKIDDFSDLNKYDETTQKIAPKGSLGAPPNLKKSEKSCKVLVDVSFWMVQGKSLAARASHEAQRTKTGDEKSNPIAPARSKTQLAFFHKTWKCL